MTIRPADYRELDECDNYDSCGKPVVAVIENNGLKILLCQDCIEELRSSIFNFKSYNLIELEEPYSSYKDN